MINAQLFCLERKRGGGAVYMKANVLICQILNAFKYYDNET